MFRLVQNEASGAKQGKILFIMHRFIVIILLLPLVLTACSTAAPVPTSTVIQAAQSTLINTATSLPTASPSPLPTFTLQPPTPTPIPPPRICTPLQDIALERMPELISNPYHPPEPGSDDPHHGVDLAMTLPNSQVATTGHPVQAALAGQVVMVTRDRFPYGNAIIIETPLQPDTQGWWAGAQIPEPAPTFVPHSALTCPAGADSPAPDPNRRSIYVLYGHMNEPASVNVGDNVSCGQGIGAVGSSGNALNPHLHFEVRVGPSGLRLNGMAHYDVSATQEEMSSYCLWRISGLYQLVDPMKVLGLTP